MSKKRRNHPFPGHFKVQSGAVEEPDVTRQAKQALGRQHAHDHEATPKKRVKAAAKPNNKPTKQARPAKPARPAMQSANPMKPTPAERPPARPASSGSRIGRAIGLVRDSVEVAIGLGRAAVELWRHRRDYLDHA
jgi:hypothetical protein